ncbi:hypothetical protein Zmor_013707 [Zophobas morio]|uniref:DDE Tnp4 domain-containing protein n=1 Tax=Zophobas morio TaxID=2755281 RepID=A0AA38IJC4_9CUCU|nr:hypothetical protein Zmor_013707 [Zophobas morio]
MQNNFNNEINNIPVFIYGLLEEDERRNYMRIYRKQLRDSQNPFEMPEVEFIKTFRLNQDLTRILIEWLEPHAGIRRRTTKLPFYLEVLATLNFLGTGSYQHSVGSCTWVAMSQPAISRSLKKVCRLVTGLLMPEWIKFPTTMEEKTAIKGGFYEKFGFRGAIGCIDGTHVEIITPPITDVDHPPHVYIDRNGVHSINVMLICDSNCKILACDARFPGSVHDSAIFRVSDIRNNLRMCFENGDDTSWLIGDSGYGQEPWLFTPIPVVAPGSPQERYNQLLRSTRNPIERTNGILKGRFRCLIKHRVLHFHPVQAAYIIYAASTLHNIALWANLALEEDEIVVENDEGNGDNAVGIVEPEQNCFNLGRAARENYIRRNIIQ